MILLRNILIYQAVWLTSVLAGAWGAAWIGLAAAAGVALAFAGSPARVAICVITSLVAWASDAAVAWFGGVIYAHHSPGWLPSPLWMLALWLNFAVMAGPILGFLRGRFVAGAAIGAIGGPLAYAGAIGLGVVSLPRPFPAYSLVAIQFTLLVPLLISVSGLKPGVGTVGGGQS